MRRTEALAEARRLMTVCNSCRYCEGLCAVFPAMEMRRQFPDGDLDYLANLCHGCGACYVDCQYSPPHEFNVNVPKTLAILRAHSYAENAWPHQLSSFFARNGLAVASAAALSMAGFIIGFVAAHDIDALFRVREGAGSFYALMPHKAMVLLFGGVFIYAIVAMAVGVLKFWAAIGETLPQPAGFQSFRRASLDAAKLRYLDGGGAGCFNEGEEPSDRRKIYHHLTFYGFLFCFAATSVATLYHYLGGREAPYAWYDAPVVLGIIGGLGLLIGPAGLFIEKLKRSSDLVDDGQFGMDTAFLAMLFMTSLSGLALLILRGTSAMGVLLALHLGLVFGFFITLPYSKFVHGIYRYAALIRYAAERLAPAER